ncbi:hypothetical protein C8R45DRAFT_1171855 [Mycena sanguinolenta]|nr:hypothetical protein C8R45DRAFT_1171855 [Mycena sanguinolenta]
MPKSQVLQAIAYSLNNTLKDIKKATGSEPTGVIKLLPCTFKEGTTVKAYQTLTADIGDYCTALEPVTAPLNEYDVKRVPKDTEWDYAVGRELKPGPVLIAVRGKNLGIAAGSHALIIHFNLEGNTRAMEHLAFESMIAQSVEGNNSDKDKADRMRSLVLLPEFRNAGARQKDGDIKINILASIVMDNNIFILWNGCLWAHFRGGPDWIAELDAALAYLDAWKAQVVAKKFRKRIANSLLDVQDTPSYSAAFSELRTHLPLFMAKWVSPEYFQRCAGRPNLNNPFALYQMSDTNFMQGYVLVYRRKEPYLRGAAGTLYNGPWAPMDKVFKWVSVQMYEQGKAKWYHVILALLSDNWNVSTQPVPFTDVTVAGFSSTLGPASFHESLQNKMDVDELKALQGKRGRGRPPKPAKTGNAGRPRHNLGTQKVIDRHRIIPRTVSHSNGARKKNQLPEETVDDTPRPPCRSRRRADK